MIFTCGKNITVKDIKFNDNVYYCAEANYNKVKKILSKFDSAIPIKGNDGIVVNKPKRKVKIEKDIKK